MPAILSNKNSCRFFHTSNSIAYHTWLLPQIFQFNLYSISFILHIAWRVDKNLEFQVTPEGKITRSHIRRSWRLPHFTIQGNNPIDKHFMKPIPYCFNAMYWSSILKPPQTLEDATE